jgi:hypothetical protein
MVLTIGQNPVIPSIVNLSTFLNFVEPFFTGNVLLSRKCQDLIMWQAVLDMINRKDHLKEGGIEVILKIRELQRHNRAFIHPSVLNTIMHLRPDLRERLRDKDIVQTPTSDLPYKTPIWDKEVS